MLNLLPLASDVVAAQFKGPLERNDLETYVEAVETALNAHDRIHLFVEIVDFGGVGLSDLQAFAGRALDMLGKLKKFGRVGVVTDSAWLRWAARVESALLPYVSYETFTLEERDIALAWVKGERERPHEPSIQIIETDRDDVLGFEIDGKLSAQDLRAAAAHFGRVLSEDGHYRVFGRINRLEGFDLEAVFDRDYLAMKRRAHDCVERYALVGGPPWLVRLAKTLDPLFKVELRHFPLEDEALAWAWLGAEPRQERPLVA